MTWTTIDGRLCVATTDGRPVRISLAESEKDLSGWTEDRIRAELARRYGGAWALGEWEAAEGADEAVASVRPADDTDGEEPTLSVLIAAAIGQWTGADWTHEYETAASRTSDDPPEICDGRGGCRTCADALADSDAADDLGRQALAALAEDDLPAATRHLEAAVRLEREYGAAPTWGPVLAAARPLRPV